MKQVDINSLKPYNKFKLIDLISNDKYSIQYFRNLRWNKTMTCPKCRYNILYNINPNRYCCKKCRYKFNIFTGTYLGKLKIKPSLITHLLHLFVSEQSAYTISEHLKCHISTIERAFRLFRQAIYDKSLQHIHQEIQLFRQRGIDERILDAQRGENHHEYKKDYDGKEYLIFAIYGINRFVVTFPVPHTEEERLGILTKQINKKKKFTYPTDYGSFYQYDNYIAYAMLDIEGSKEENKVVASNDIESGEGENMYIGLDGFWNYIKKWLYHYRGVRIKYFHLYLKEIEFRFNNRNNDMFHELSKLLVEPFSSNR